MMDNNIKTLSKSFAAGICIGLGTVTYLLITNKLLGAFIFGMGLFLVCLYGLKLCTGMAGYLLDSDIDSQGFFPVILGNFIGIGSVYILSSLWNNNIMSIAHNILITKLDQENYKLFISALFCGLLMFLAVDIYGHAVDVNVKVLGIFLAVPCFILNGFDHCVVTMFYTLSSASSNEALQSVVLVFVVAMGNFIGALCGWWLFRFINWGRIVEDTDEEDQE